MQAPVPSFRVSVIIAAYNAQATIGACLESLKAQSARQAFEVIVVDSSSSDETSRIVKAGLAKARLFRFKERKFCGEARNIGIAHARADIVAFLDADCTAPPDWVSEIIKAHKAGDIATGGSIANGNPQNYVGWAAYFTEFSQWTPGTPGGWMGDIAGANMSYKKDIFTETGPFIKGTYSSDTEFHWRLKDRGVRIRFVPSIKVFHKNITSLPVFLKHEFQHGRFFAKVRLRHGNFPKSKRWLYGFFFFFIPFKLISKIASSIIKKRRYTGIFLLSLPLLFLGLFFWSFGEGMGYLTVSKNG